MRIAAVSLVLMLISASPAWADETKVKLADDGYPTGQNTPEGVACDMARAFIQHDPALFRNVVIAPYGSDKTKGELKEFVDQVVKDMDAQKALPDEERTGPASIGVCFAARRLTMNGPASMAYALFNYHDLMFVDVGVHLRDGGKTLCRTLVLMNEKGTWFVHPCPSISPLLMSGLNEEDDSKQTFQQKYGLEAEDKPVENPAIQD